MSAGEGLSPDLASQSKRPVKFQLVRQVAEFGPDPPQFRRFRSMFDQRCPQLWTAPAPRWSKSAQLSSASANIGRYLAEAWPIFVVEAGTSWPTFGRGRSRPAFGRAWLIFVVEAGPTSVDIGQHSSTSAHMWPKSVRFLPDRPRSTSAKSGQTLDSISPTSTELAEIGAAPGQIWPNSGRHSGRFALPVQTTWKAFNLDSTRKKGRMLPWRAACLVQQMHEHCSSNCSRGGSREKHA